MLVIVLIAMVSLHASAGELQGPRIYIAEGRFDFGTVAEGIQPEHIFTIQNVGDAVLEIRRVQPT